MGITVKRQRPTPLMTAVQKQDVEAVKKRIAAGDALEERDAFGQTALHWATKYDSVEIVKLLIEAGAKTNVRDEDGDTPLANAKRSGHTDAAQLLQKKRRWF